MRLTSNSLAIPTLSESGIGVSLTVGESIAESNGVWLSDFIFETLCTSQRETELTVLAREHDIDRRGPQPRRITRVTRKGFPPRDARTVGKYRQVPQAARSPALRFFFPAGEDLREAAELRMIRA
jgi:hypothetical protein